MDDLRDPEFRRAEITRLREEIAATEADTQARWMREEVVEAPQVPLPSTRAPTRAAAAPDRRPRDVEVRMLIRAEIDAAVRDLLEAVGLVIAQERDAHRKETRRLRCALRDLRRAVHKRER